MVRVAGRGLVGVGAVRDTVPSKFTTGAVDSADNRLQKSVIVSQNYDETTVDAHARRSRRKPQYAKLAERKTRSTQSIAQTPNGLSHARHSFWPGCIGLSVVPAIDNKVTIAVTYIFNYRSALIVSESRETCVPEETQWLNSN